MTKINNYILYEMQDLSTMMSCFRQAISPPEPIASQLFQLSQQNPNVMNQDPNMEDPNAMNQDTNMEDPNAMNQDPNMSIDSIQNSLQQ